MAESESGSLVGPQMKGKKQKMEMAQIFLSFFFTTDVHVHASCSALCTAYPISGFATLKTFSFFFPRNGNRLVPLLIPSHEMEIRMKYEEFISMKLKPHSLY